MNLERRTVLKCTGLTAAASTAGLAGCLDTVGFGGGDEGSEYPSSESWLAATDGSIEFATLEWAALEEFEALEDEVDREASDEADDGALVHETDLLLEMPAMGALIIALGVGFGFWGTGLDGIITTDDDDDGDTAADFETTVEELLWINDVYVLAGEIDTEEIVDALTEEPNDAVSMTRTYERSDEYADYELYEPAENDDEYAISSLDDAIAVSEDAIIYAGNADETDAAEQIQRVLDVREGDRDGATDVLEEFGWLLETAGHGQMVIGMAGELDEDDADGPAEEDLDDPAGDDEFESATGLVSSLSVEDGGGLSADYAMTFESIDDDTKAELEDTLGVSADDVTIEFDDDRLTASASWDDADILE
ncbi:hypothetical protein [Natronorubrum halophilum]|uniref:hypothetical protein n=1 Tax=Natronorubrum halophilum TaxID=1702106 RepID=UPI0010C18B7A|nr:hypothetical protein [Natronorubrum halophilum]